MATLYSVEADKIADISNQTGDYAPNRAGDGHGRKRCAFFTYNCSGSEATNDIIHLNTVPAGARILAIFVANEDCGTTVTADIGDSGDTDRFVQAYALGTAAIGFTTLRRDDTETDETPTLGFGYRYSASTSIYATLTTVTTPTANATFRGYIEYTVD